KYIGSYMVAVGGADAIVFTAGIGENDVQACEDVIKGFEWMGIKIDPAKNKRGVAGIISTDDSTVKVLRIPTNEELPIARDTLEIVSKL
ncbi:MAG: acetate kinase, partial [Kiritimatiellae bacterium]|nr:acetate kinase [Kiritimatiellia bacterium]